MLGTNVTTLGAHLMEFEEDQFEPAANPPSLNERLEEDEMFHHQIRDHVLARVDDDKTSRLRRLGRYGRTDLSLSTWQKLSPEDSFRDKTEESTGRSQAIPMNLPVAEAHVEDTSAFFADVFAPIGGSFYANPAKRTSSESIKTLVDIMNQDSKSSDYFSSVAFTMRSLCKYNLGGFELCWQEPNPDGESGNVLRGLDMYNTIWDPSVEDVRKVYKEAEWAGYIELKNRFWLIREGTKQGFAHLTKLLDTKKGDNVDKSRTDASHFRSPYSESKIEPDGADGRSELGENGASMTEDQWGSFGLGSKATSSIQVRGHEVINVYIWINREQFDIDYEGLNPLALYRVKIVDCMYVVHMEEIDNAVEIPIYLGRMRVDQLHEAARSLAELIRPFGRFSSFLINTHVANLRGSVYGTTVYDPSVIDASKVRPGEVAGVIPTKKPGQDVRTAFTKVQNNATDTSNNVRDAGSILELMRQFFPNQALPQQVASIDRAVTNQVTAVMQGAMRKLHMFARMLDSSLMMPTRRAMFRNIVNNDKTKAGRFKEMTTEEINDVLSSGLGQMVREAAAEQVRSLIFALIQNPSAAQAFDMQGLWTLYSALLSIGTDLGEFLMQKTLTNEAPVDPAAAAGGPQANGASSPTPMAMPGIGG
jgi:hypothetical protein